MRSSMYVRSGNCAIKSPTVCSFVALPAPVTPVPLGCASSRSAKSPNCASAAVAATAFELLVSAALVAGGKSSKASSKPEAAADAPAHRVAQKCSLATVMKAVNIMLGILTWHGVLRHRRQCHAILWTRRLLTIETVSYTHLTLPTTPYV